MKSKIDCKFTGYKLMGIAVILFMSVGSLSVVAQTKKVVLQNFTFYPFLTQKSTDDPLVLPYESKSSSILVQVDETEDYETVQDFLNDYESPIKKSTRVETINGLTSGWVITESDEDENTRVLAGMVKHKATGDRLLIVMEYPANSMAAEKNAMTMFRSFRHNPVVVATQPVIPSKPANTNPSNNNPPTNNPPTTNPGNTNQTSNAVNPQQILTAHNAYRSELGLPSLTWSANLASYAQAWANELANNKGCQLSHRPHDTNSPWNLIYGENIFSGSGGYTFVDAVNDWASEKADFNPQTRKCKDGTNSCGHYTQIVWRTTTQVGCAVAKCPNGWSIMVCNYNPPGNWNGQPAY